MRLIAEGTLGGLIVDAVLATACGRRGPRRMPRPDATVLILRRLAPAWCPSQEGFPLKTLMPVDPFAGSGHGGTRGDREPCAERKRNEITMEPRPARAILYCRSRREQAERGLANQERHLRTYADEQGLVIVGVESDALGVKEDERPGLQRVLARAEQHEFDVLLVRNTARLARDARALELLRERLAVHGVRIISLASGETDD